MASTHWIFVPTLVGLAAACGLALVLLLSSCKGGPEERQVARRVPSPILFLHGIASSAETWNEAGVTAFLQSKGLKFGGVVRLGAEGSAGFVAPS